MTNWNEEEHHIIGIPCLGSSLLVRGDFPSNQPIYTYSLFFAIKLLAC